MSGRGFLLRATMPGMERPPQPKKPETYPDTGSDVDIEDYADNETLYRLLMRLPKDLRNMHMQRVAHLEDEEATGYLYALHERRDAALRESNVSDESLKPYFEAHKEQIWEALETRVFSDAPENQVGRGSTAKVHKFELEDYADDNRAPVEEVAVKYLVSPNATTLSVSGEHDLIVEVEQMRRIEAAENASIGPNSRIRVPHPYFYYQKGPIQCYAMELVDGVNLEKGISGEYKPEVGEDLRSSLKDVDRAALMQEIDSFFDTMHTICHHGDIKPANMMVSRDGTFYVIDFGQSKLMTSVGEEHHVASEEWKDGEKKRAKEVVRRFLEALFTEAKEAA